MEIRADGSQTLIAQAPDPHFDLDASKEAASLLGGTLPNGLAFAANGDFLVANYGTDRLERMDRTGKTQVLLEKLDGKPLGKVNFVLRDSRDRIWITVSTKINPWSNAITPALADGYIILIDEKGPRIVADGIHFANEIRFDAREEWLYVVETTAKCVSRFRVLSDGSLTDREIYGPSSLGHGLPDGIAFDDYGNLWTTMVFADRLVAITPQGDALELLSLGDPVATATFEAAFATGEDVPMEIMLACGGTICNWLASVTFGGPDLKTAYLGSLRSSSIPYFRSPVSGLAMVHW